MSQEYSEYISLLFTYHWPELSFVATFKYNRSQEIKFSCLPQGKKIILTNSCIISPLLGVRCGI